MKMRVKIGKEKDRDQEFKIGVLFFSIYLFAGKLRI